MTLKTSLPTQTDSLPNDEFAVEPLYTKQRTQEPQPTEPDDSADLATWEDVINKVIQWLQR
jgi:hypothetical protein